MKFERNQRYSSIAIYSFLVISASIVFYLVVSKLNGVMSHLKVFTMIFTPITIGIVMAYLFNFILVLIEDKILGKFSIKKNFRRFLGLFLTYLTVVILFSLFLKFIFPQLVSSLVGLVNDIPMHVRDIGNILNDMSEKFNFDEEINKFEQLSTDPELYKEWAIEFFDGETNLREDMKEETISQIYEGKTLTEEMVFDIVTDIEDWMDLEEELEKIPYRFDF